MKRCCRCKAEKPLTEFNHSKARKDGYQDDCRACHHIVNKAWAARNPDKNREAHRRWNKKNPNGHREWVKRNRSKICEYSSRWQASNREACADRTIRHSLRKQGISDPVVVAEYIMMVRITRTLKKIKILLERKQSL